MKYRELIALQVMKATQDRATPSNDFMLDLRLAMPRPKRRIAGALGDTENGLARGQFSRNDLKLKCQMVTEWGIGAFDGHEECSTVYDPDSPWYNTFYGSYAFRSYKAGGVPWGYAPGGAPEFGEITSVYEIDYNFFIAWTFGCPEEKLCFDAKATPRGQHDGWDVAEVEATVPSLLHWPWLARNPASYLVYGTPELGLLSNHLPYEPVKMLGQVYMRVALAKAGEPPITVAWGALCPHTAQGNTLMHDIVDAFLHS